LRAYCPGGQQTEAIIVRPGGPELRTKVTTLPKVPTWMNVQGQVLSDYGSDIMGGSGVPCLDRQGTWFLLTCAHNFMQVGTSVSIPNSIEYHYSKIGKGTELIRSPVSKMTVHPQYSAKATIFSGCDIAIGRLTMDFSKAPISTNSYWGCFDDLSVKIGSPILVTGYPVDKGGDLYYMKGTVSKITEIEKGKKLIHYSDLDTTGGQSGSPCYLIGSDGCLTIIGVHVGYDSSSKSNIATALTKEIQEWILAAARLF